jgi:RND family efflux transporter MFP subunit
LLATFVPLLTGCDDPQPLKSEVRPVRTIVADPKPIQDDRQAVGEIRPRLESDLGFRVSGKVVARAVDVGARVKAGEVLARLDEQDFRNKLRSAEADVSAAEAVLADAKATEERQSTLLAKGVTTRANYDAAVKNSRSAEASVDSARAALALARDQLRYAELKADFDGIVTATGAEPGQVVNVGQMVIRLADPSEVDAVFNVAEIVFKDRRPNERPAVTVSLLSSPDIVTDGVVREVSPVADPVTRTYQVKVALENPPPAMRFGASVMGRLKSTTGPLVVLPGSALYDDAGKPAVWIFDSTSSTVKLRPVTVARFDLDRVVVSDGLGAGDIVVTAGVNRLREGQQVRLLESASP